MTPGDAMPLNILLLCDHPPYGTNASTVLDHIQAPARYGRHNVHILANQGEIPAGIALEAFDAVVLHYSIYLLDSHHLGPRSRERLARFKGLKVLFLQDEYRRVYDFVKVIDQLGIDVLFTCLPEKLADLVYPVEALPRLRKVQCYTGYVPERLLDVPSLPMGNRPIDVFYRGRRNGYWLGSLALDKWRIVDLVRTPFVEAGLNVDLAFDENARLYGNDWIEALRRTRAVLGVESGASVIDYTGNIERATMAYLRVRPDASYEEAESTCFPGRDMLFSSAQISPRCFEAAALRTALVLFEGEYSGILTPWRHYLPLAKDGSNLPEVIEHLRNDAFLEELTERAYREIACNPAYSYRAFAERFDDVCDEEASLRRTRAGNASARELHALLTAHTRGSIDIAEESAEPPDDDPRGGGTLATARSTEKGSRRIRVWHGAVSTPHAAVRAAKSIGKSAAKTLGWILARSPNCVRLPLQRSCAHLSRFFSLLAGE
jgi:hypothetical protein